MVLKTLSDREGPTRYNTPRFLPQPRHASSLPLDLALFRRQPFSGWCPGCFSLRRDGDLAGQILCPPVFGFGALRVVTCQLPDVPSPLGSWNVTPAA